MDNPFHHAPAGLTRFPLNVEQISVIGTRDRVFITMRRNDVYLQFSLTRADCEHLAAMLLSPKDAPPVHLGLAYDQL